MSIKFDADLTSIDKIQKAIADIGYDNEGFRSENKIYENHTTVANTNDHKIKE